MYLNSNKAYGCNSSLRRAYICDNRDFYDSRYCTPQHRTCYTINKSYNVKSCRNVFDNENIGTYSNTYNNKKTGPKNIN